MITFTPKEEAALRSLASQWRAARHTAANTNEVADWHAQADMAETIAEMIAELFGIDEPTNQPTDPPVAPTDPSDEQPPAGTRGMLVATHEWVAGSRSGIGGWIERDRLWTSRLGDGLNWAENQLTGKPGESWCAVVFPYVWVNDPDADTPGATTCSF